MYWRTFCRASQFAQCDGDSVAQVFFSVFAFFINAHYSGVLLGYGPWRQLREIMPFGLVAMAMAAIVCLVGS